LDGTRALSLPIRLLFPLGLLFLCGPPAKYVLGERAGGLVVLTAFAAGWLAIGVLLSFERYFVPPLSWARAPRRMAGKP
jgi:hypothetical protein